MCVCVCVLMDVCYFQYNTSRSVHEHDDTENTQTITLERAVLPFCPFLNKDNIAIYCCATQLCLNVHLFDSFTFS